MKKISLQNINDIFKVPVQENTDGYELLQEYFVDSSGFGEEGERALTKGQFIAQLWGYLSGYGKPVYACITSVGQFQVYIGLFKRLPRNPLIKKIGVATTKEITPNGFKIKYHNTVVYEEKDNHIFLDNGGWTTNTTKKRINEFLPYPYYVYQKNYNWYLTNGTNTIDFTRGQSIDNITIL